MSHTRTQLPHSPPRFRFWYHYYLGGAVSLMDLCVINNKAMRWRSSVPGGARYGGRDRSHVSSCAGVAVHVRVLRFDCDEQFASWSRLSLLGCGTSLPSVTHTTNVLPKSFLVWLLRGGPRLHRSLSTYEISSYKSQFAKTRRTQFPTSFLSSRSVIALPRRSLKRIKNSAVNSRIQHYFVFKVFVIWFSSKQSKSSSSLQTQPNRTQFHFEYGSSEVVNVCTDHWASMRDHVTQISVREEERDELSFRQIS